MALVVIQQVVHFSSYQPLQTLARQAFGSAANATPIVWFTNMAVGQTVFVGMSIYLWYIDPYQSGSPTIIIQTTIKEQK